MPNAAAAKSPRRRLYAGGRDGAGCRRGFCECKCIPVSCCLLRDVAQVTETELVVGAAVTLSRLQARLRDLFAAGAPHETGVFAALLEQLRYFAGVQIRNVATVGGCGAVALQAFCCLQRTDVMRPSPWSGVKVVVRLLVLRSGPCGRSYLTAFQPVLYMQSSWEATVTWPCL